MAECSTRRAMKWGGETQTAQECMVKKERTTKRYPRAPQLDLGVTVEAPLYNECLDWMSELPDSRAATLDFWARGNFVRHLLYTRQSARHPLLIPAAHPKQMDWVYRHLALAGVPVIFVYTGYDNDSFIFGP
jgi:hypothetical protein